MTERPAAPAAERVQPPGRAAAIIGTGFMGAAHLESLRRLGVPVAGLLGSNAASGQAAAGRLGVRAYASLAELLADPAVGAVHQCGPNAVHAEQNRQAISAGKHVYSEKPLGVSVAECAAQLQAARAAGVRHAVNFTYRGYAAVQTLRGLVQAGELGEVRYLRGHYLQDWLLYPGDHNWRVEAPASETRAVADIGSHLADLARHVTGLEPRALLARFSTLHPQRLRPAGAAQATQTFGAAAGGGVPVPVQTEDQASLLLDYQGGVRASFELSQVAAGHKNDLMLEVLGTRGSATWRQERPEELELGSRETRRVILLKDPAGPLSHYPGGHPEGYPDALTNLIRVFYDERLDPQALQYATFGDGLAAAEFVQAAYQSASAGQWVTLGELPT